MKKIQSSWEVSQLSEVLFRVGTSRAQATRRRQHGARVALSKIYNARYANYGRDGIDSCVVIDSQRHGTRLLSIGEKFAVVCLLACAFTSSCIGPGDTKAGGMCVRIHEQALRANIEILFCREPDSEPERRASIATLASKKLPRGYPSSLRLASALDDGR